MIDCWKCLFWHLGSNCSFSKASILKCFPTDINWANLHSSGVIWSKITSESSGGKVCPRASTNVNAGASTWFSESLFFTFQLQPFADALMFAGQCWKTNVAQSRSESCCEGTLKIVWHMCLTKKFKTSNGCFELWIVDKFYPPNRNRECND